MKYNACFFDLDGTLYDERCGLMDHVNRKIDEWILKTISIPEAEVPEFRRDLFTRYGGTLPGLTAEYGSDFYASLRYCHDLPVEDFVAPNPLLRETLMKLDCRKYVFTSSYRFYSVRVLKALNILDCFDGIIDAVDVYPHPKPSPLSYRRALEITAEKDVRRCAFFDDHPRNVAAAHAEGFFAVQVGYHSRSESADASILKIEDLLTIPEFHMEGDSVL